MKKIILTMMFLSWGTIYLFADALSESVRFSNNIKIWTNYEWDMPRSDNYPLSNAFDNNPMTTWVMKGKKIIIKTPYKIRGFYITNGYSKSQCLYEANNIILEVIVKSDKFEKNYKLKETLFPQFIQFPKPVKKIITISLVKIKKGKKYNDVCISELKIDPKPENDCFLYGTGGNFECLELFKNYKKQYIFPRDTLCSHSFLKRGKYIIFLQDPINSDMYLYSIINTASGNIYKYKLRSFDDISEAECDYSIVNDRIKYTAEKGKKKSIKIKFPK